MSLLYVVAACLAVHVTAETTASPPEDKVSYRGSQLLWVCPAPPKDSPQHPLAALLQDQAVEFWNKNETCSQFLVSGEKVDEVKATLDDAGLKYDVTIEDLQRAIDDENPPVEDEDELSPKGEERLVKFSWSDVWDRLRPTRRPRSTTTRRPTQGNRNGHKLTWSSYHRLADIYGFLDYLAQTYPDKVTVGTVGTSVEGRPIKYVKISSGQPSAKAFWIDGGIHAREWISPASVTYIIRELVENEAAHTKETSGIDYYVVPVLNPDGYEYTHLRDRLWRKNRSKGSYYCQGTDLNRNWGYKWGGKGSSKQQCQEIYGGSSAFSEPETQSVSRFISSSVPNAKGFVTFHSYGQYILYPYGYDDNQLPVDVADLERVGRKAAQAIRQVGGSAYTVGNSAKTLYAASGGADDWAKGTAGIKYSYTIELRDRGRYGFVLPAQFIQPTAKEALAAIKVISAEIKALP